MKKIIFTLICIIFFVYFKVSTPSFLELSDSLAQDEIALTFINDSLLLIHLHQSSFLLQLNEEEPDSIIKKFCLQNVPIYKISEKPVINELNISYHNDLEFSFIYASKKFCLGSFYGCDFTYLYQNDSFIDANVYFYNKNTQNLLHDVIVLSYSTDSIISVLWDQRNYMIVTY